MGCKINGYCSDMTRTIFVGGITEEQQQIYNLVLNNQKKALNEIHDGVNIKSIVRGVESDFNLNNQTLIHSLGHGVGLNIHENPVDLSIVVRIISLYLQYFVENVCQNCLMVEVIILQNYFPHIPIQLLVKMRKKLI